jgi:inhibitor of KinA
MLNLTKFYYLNSTTITFNLTECKRDNFIGLFQNLKKNGKIIEVVTTDNSMTLFLREAMNHDKILDIINKSINSNKKNHNKSKTFHLPICFDDSFQDDILNHYDGDLKLTQKFKESFLKNKFTLEYYGFLPGFAYFSGLESKLHLPRKKIPSSKIDKGTVAIGGEYVGIYPQDSPGGWNCIANCPIPLVDFGSNLKININVFDQVIFEEIEFENYKKIKLDYELDVYDFKIL